MTPFAKFGLDDLSPRQPVLIAGPTASGKSALALAIAQAQGGIIINADASQIYNCWRVITACPSASEEARAPHALYRHVSYDAPYSAGHWLREVVPLLKEAQRPIIVGGTGLYFSALTQGLAEIPATPTEIRALGDTLTREAMLSEVDTQTQARIDVLNRARVQRAWEVQRATGMSLAQWQARTPPPALPPDAAKCIVMDAPKDWLNARIARRFELMMQAGAMEEIAAMAHLHDPALPAWRAIGVPELLALHKGEMTQQDAIERAVIATRQYAKRQRTWFRSKMKDWHHFNPREMS